MTSIVILAAGKGTRMNSELPKVLVPVNGRPMITYLLDAVTAASGPEGQKPLIVVSPDNRRIIGEALRDYAAGYVIQEEQLGTGHAVSVALPATAGADNILVLYGDHPFLTAASITRFLNDSPEAMTIMPAVLPDFEGWRQNFYHWGRIIRNAGGDVEKIVEFKDASDEEKKVLEVNPGFMCFNRAWLAENITKLRNLNKQAEYYLTDMVGIAFAGGHKIGTINIEPREAMGINSQEELKLAAEAL